MGQHTEHHEFACACGDGRVHLTTTRFSVQAARRIHTELVRCDTCKGRYAYRLREDQGDVVGADAEERATGLEVPLCRVPP